MATAKTTEAMRVEILEFVHKSEATITKAGHKLSERVAELVPGDGQSIRRVVDEAFDFTETILKNQRELANSLLDKALGKPSSKRAKSGATSTTRKATRQSGAA